MTWLCLSIALAATPGVEAPLAPALPLEPAVEVRARSEQENPVAYSLSSTAVLLTTTTVALATLVAVHMAPLAIEGRPNPWVTAGGLGAMVGVNFGLSHLAVPWLASTFRGDADTATLRGESFRITRWALIPGAVGAITYAVGAGLENASFGRGQGVMIAGALTSVLSMVVFDVVAAVAGWSVHR